MFLKKGVNIINIDGKRITISKKRAFMLDVLKENYCKHLTAEEIHELVCKKDKNIGIATVYRNLKFFEQNGYIKRAYISENLSACYELQKQNDKHSHHHLICKNCGSANDFEDDLLDAIEKIIDVTTGFEIHDHNLVFYGKCKKCKRSGQDE